MIQFEQLTKTFRHHIVLDKIDLSIGMGDRIALIGSNGAGKTTLIRCLLGEYTFDGAVTVGGLSPREERREAQAYRLCTTAAATAKDAGRSTYQLRSIVV